MENRRIIQVEEKVPPKLLIPLSIQHMFAMFGASVLVPFIFGINPAIVLFMNGVGTLLFILITKGKHRLPGLQLCFYRSGQHCYQQVWLRICPGRFRGCGILRLYPGTGYLQIRFGLD